MFGVLSRTAKVRSEGRIDKLRGCLLHWPPAGSPGETIAFAVRLFKSLHNYSLISWHILGCRSVRTKSHSSNVLFKWGLRVVPCTQGLRSALDFETDVWFFLEMTSTP